MHAHRPHRRRAAFPAVLVATIAVLTLLIPVLDTTAQVIRANPTPTPTEEFDPGLGAQPTEEPSGEDEPGVTANPTAEPTELPPPPPPPSSLTLNTGACDDSTFDPYSATGLQTFLDACQGPDGEFEFTVSDGAGFSETASTSLGTVTFEVPVGTVSITETIPGGWGDPAVFCWSNFLTTPSENPFIGNGPSWDVQPGEQVECWWFNIAEPPVQLHTIQVAKRLCPEDADITVDYWTLATTCTEPMSGVDFQLLTGVSILDGETDDTGAIEWTEVDFGGTGTIQIDEAVPEGYGEPAVWCVSFPEAAADPEDFEFFAAPSADGTVTVEPEIHEPFIFSCSFFNQASGGDSGELAGPAALEGGEENTLILHKYRCPPGAPYEDFGSDIFEYCTDPHVGMEFSLYHDEITDHQSTDANGEIIWTGLPAGEFTIVEQIVTGHEDLIAYCMWTVVPEGVVVQAGRFPIPAPEAQFVLDFPTTGMTIECGAFNIPRYESRIVVNKRLCPAGVDLVLTDENTINDMIVACPIQGNGIEFTLDNAHGSSTQAIDGGDTHWDGVPHGPFTLTEDMPEGYVDAVWYCGTNPFDEDGVLEGFPGWVELDAPGGVLAESIDEEWGEIFACWVFNIPDPDAGSVTVVKWLCPEGFVSEVDNPLTDCTELWDGVAFHLNDLEATTGDAGPGLATFLNLPPGEYDLVETIPDGIAEAFYSICYLDEVSQPLSIDLTDPPTLNITVAAGEHWVCHVYNVPEEDEENSVEIHKWHCPEGTGPDETLDWYEENCTEEHDGVDFKVASGIGIAVAETSSGQVQFDGLPAGDVSIQETIPDGFGPPAVFCAPEDSLWMQYDAPTGHWGYDFLDDGVSEILTCHVFNIPGEPPSITVLKWSCPAGYDLLTWGADPSVDCTEATNGVDFELRFEGNPALVDTQTTGDEIDGGVVFDDLEPDIYNIAELVPDGIASAFVLECTGHIMGVLQPYPLQYGPVLDDIDLDAGEHLTCFWFNVPDEDGGSITLSKYTCQTETFVSEVECQIEEDGVTFDLLIYAEEEAAWVVVDTRETDGFGRIDWTDLNSGEYRVAEHGADWCQIVFDPADDGDHVRVLTGDHAEIHVYNCDGTPGEPGDTPTKYPNTGVPPEATPSGRRD